MGAQRKPITPPVDAQRVFSVSTTLFATVTQNGEYSKLSPLEQDAVRRDLCELLSPSGDE